MEEKNLFWCSSSEVNDQRTVTAGYDSDITEPYAFRGVRCSMWMDVLNVQNVLYNGFGFVNCVQYAQYFLD